MTRSLRVHIETWPSEVPFRISGHTFDDFPCIVVELEQDGFIGRGEALGVYYSGETPDSMAAQLRAVERDLCTDLDRQQLLRILPPGGARFAADSALWDLQAKRMNNDVWQQAGTAANPVETVMTIGLEESPEAMAGKATGAANLSLFKVKLNNDRPVERIAAIRAARPDARLIVDVNEGWSFAELQDFGPRIVDLGVLMIEQPLARGADAELAGFRLRVPLCADESCLHLGELDEIAGRYQMINIKLDKTGGLTHALQLADAAQQLGLGLMVGCMGGTSLSMAPSHVIAQRCDFVDLDGPLLIGKDREGALVYDNGWISLPEQPFWGC